VKFAQTQEPTVKKKSSEREKTCKSDFIADRLPFGISFARGTPPELLDLTSH
jgi:hypothetical protein